jgi:hypothetical protein
MIKFGFCVISCSIDAFASFGASSSLSLLQRTSKKSLQFFFLNLRGAILLDLLIFHLNRISDAESSVGLMFIFVQIRVGTLWKYQTIFGFEEAGDRKLTRFFFKNWLLSLETFGRSKWYKVAQ